MTQTFLLPLLCISLPVPDKIETTSKRLILKSVVTVFYYWTARFNLWANGALFFVYKLCSKCPTFALTHAISQCSSVINVLLQTFTQGSCGSLKVLEFFSRFSRPGKSLKTDMVLESPWICVWRSLKVLELDFLKRRDRTSDCYHQMRFLGSNATEMH